MLFVDNGTAAKRATDGVVFIVCCNCVMIFKIIYFFQFSNNNSEKYLNRYYYNNIKDKMHLRRFG